MADMLSALKTDKNELLKKMVKIPEHATHVGIANVPGMGMTAVVTSELSTPSVYDPKERRWVQLITRIGP